MSQPAPEHDSAPGLAGLLLLPRPWLSVDAGRVLCDAPIRRPAGDASVYVRGRVTTAGRDPIQLGYWRRAVPTPGTDAVASEQVALAH